MVSMAAWQVVRALSRSHPPPCCFMKAAARFGNSSGGTSSLCVAIPHLLPNESLTLANRRPRTCPSAPAAMSRPPGARACTPRPRRSRKERPAGHRRSRTRPHHHNRVADLHLGMHQRASGSGHAHDFLGTKCLLHEIDQFGCALDVQLRRYAVYPSELVLTAIATLLSPPRRGGSDLIHHARSRRQAADRCGRLSVARRCVTGPGCPLRRIGPACPPGAAWSSEARDDLDL